MSRKFFSEREYDQEQTAFLMAISRYKRNNQLVDLSPRDILAIVKSLGYQKRPVVLKLHINTRKVGDDIS